LFLRYILTIFVERLFAMNQIYISAKVLFSALFMLIISFASANTINSITIIPEKPQAGDEIKVVLNSTLAGCFKFNSSVISSDSNSFYTDAVYFETQPGCKCMCQYSDTISLGKIKEGNYYLIFGLYVRYTNSSGNSLIKKDTIKFSVGPQKYGYSNILNIVPAFPKKGDEIILVSKNRFEAGCNLLDSAVFSITGYTITAVGYHATPECLVYDPFSIDSISLGKLPAGTYDLTYYFKTHEFNSHNDVYASKLQFTVFGTENNFIKALKINPAKPIAGEVVSITGFFSDGNCTLQSKMTGISGSDIFVEASYNSLAMCPSKNDSSTAALGYLPEGNYRLIYLFTDNGTHEYDIDTLFFTVLKSPGKCIPLETVKILPSVPTTDDDIKLIVYYYADCCNKIDFSNPVISRDSTNIKVLLSQSSPPDTLIPCDCMPRLFADTIPLGKFPVGFYNANIITNPGCNDWHNLSFVVALKNICNFTTSLDLVPANPEEGEEVKVAGRAFFPSGGCNLIDKSVKIKNSQIWVSTIHEMGMLTYICNSTDTISLGKLNYGKYQLIFTTGVKQLNCIDFDTLNFVVAPSPVTYSITGAVMADSSFVNSGVVILFHKSENYFKPVQISHLDNGKYSFSNIKEGNYIIYAIPNFYIYPGYLPTYYHDAICWKNADLIHVDADKSQLNISLHSFNPLLQDGKGWTSGTVTYENDSTYETAIYKIPWFTDDTTKSKNLTGNIAMNMPVILFDDLNIPVAWTLSDESGNFEFPGIPWGTYTLIVEKAGINPAEKPIISLNENNNENNIIITIRTEDITVSLNNLIYDTNSVFLYPNPVIDKLNIAVNSEQISDFVLNIYNSTGQKVYANKYKRQVGISKIIVNVSALSSGVYFVRIGIDTDKYLSLKFVK